MSWLYQPLMAASLLSGGGSTLLETDIVLNNEYLISILKDNIITLENSILLNSNNLLNNENILNIINNTLYNYENNLLLNSNSLLNNEILLRVNSVVSSAGSQEYVDDGSYSWLCPENVTEVSVFCFGSGANGTGGTGNVSGGTGGNAGDFSFKTVSVTPGNSYDVVVGGAGTGSYFNDSSTVFAKGGDNTGTNVGDLIYEGGDGVTYTGLTGGGGGGAAGSESIGNGATGSSGGSGGTGTYPGGAGGDGSNSSDGNNGSLPGGGGGGGGGNTSFTPTQNEIVRISFDAGRDNYSGYITITDVDNSQTSLPIYPGSDNESAIVSAINGGISYYNGNVSVSFNGTDSFDIEFINALAGINIGTITYDDTYLKLPANNISIYTSSNGFPAYNEIQVVYLGGATSGTFDIDSVTVSSLDYSGIQAALDSIYGSSNTQVTDNFDGSFNVEFLNSLANQDISEMTITSNSTDGSPYIGTLQEGNGGNNQIISVDLTDGPTEGMLSVSIGAETSSEFNYYDSSPASISGWTGGGTAGNWTYTRDYPDNDEESFSAAESVSYPLLKNGIVTGISEIQSASGSYANTSGGLGGDGKVLIMWNSQIECICPLIENLLSVITSNVLNLEYQLKVNTDNSVNIEWVAEADGSVTADLVLLIEHLCGVQAEETIQDEWNVSVNQNNNISIEYTLNAANSNALTLEHILGVTFDTTQNIEHATLINKNSESLLEYLLNTNTSLLVNSENLQRINSSNLILCTEHLLNLNSDLISYLEHIINLNISSTLNLEHLTNIANQIVILNEFLLKNRTDTELQNEFLLVISKFDVINTEYETDINQIDADFILNYEYVNSVNIDKILSVEYLEELRSNIQLNIEQGLYLESNKILLLEHLLKLSNDLVYNAESLKLVEANYTTLIEHLLKLQADLVFNSDINLQLSKTMTTNIESLLSVYIDRQTVYEYLGQIDSSLQLNNEFVQKLNADKDLLLEHNLLLNKSMNLNYDFTLLTSSDYLINVEYLTKIINDIVINIDISPEDLSNVIPLLVWILKTRKKVYILSDNSARNNLWQKVARKYNLVLPDKSYTYFLKGRNFSWRL